MRKKLCKTRYWLFQNQVDKKIQMVDLISIQTLLLIGAKKDLIILTPLKRNVSVLIIRRFFLPSISMLDTYPQNIETLRLLDLISWADIKQKSFIEPTASSAAYKFDSLCGAKHFFSLHSLLHIDKFTICRGFEYRCNIRPGDLAIHLKILHKIRRRISNNYVIGLAFLPT